MITADLFEETYSSLTVNKSRTGLTMLGIVIGIGSVIAMISIGQGAQSSIQASIQSIGSNLILVAPGFQRGVGTQVSAGRGSAQSLDAADAREISEQISLATAVAPEASRRYQVTARGTNTNTQVVGTTAAYPGVRNLQMADGAFISDQNVAFLARVAVLGPTTRDDLFGAETDVLGQTIRINKTDFKVIGVTQSKGGTGFTNQDDMIFIPLSTAQRLLAGNDSVTTISIQAPDQESMTTIQEQVTALLLDRHHISDPQLADFSVLNQADIVQAASSVTNTFTILLGAVAGISLVVGGIGIMNMMLTAVTERTREIGLRKAIGAKQSDVSIQFLAESVMLTVAGGLVGIVFGWLISLGVSHFGGLTTHISLFSVALAFGVSALIGIVFGYYPARRAAGLNPIEALRYE